MHRQAPLAFGVLASCAVIASGSILLREQILSFSSWPEASRDGDAPQIAIPNVRPLALHAAGAARPGELTPRVRTDAARARLLGLGAGGGTFTLAASRPVGVGGSSEGGRDGRSGRPAAHDRRSHGQRRSGDRPGRRRATVGLRRWHPRRRRRRLSGLGASPRSRRAPCRWSRRPRCVSPHRRRPTSPLRPTSAPVVSSADNAPPPQDPAGTPVLVPSRRRSRRLRPILRRLPIPPPRLPSPRRRPIRLRRSRRRRRLSRMCSHRPSRRPRRTRRPRSRRRLPIRLRRPIRGSRSSRLEIRRHRLRRTRRPRPPRSASRNANGAR